MPRQRWQRSLRRGQAREPEQAATRLTSDAEDFERARRGARRRRPRPRRPLKKSDDPPSPRQPSRCTPSRIACRTRTVWQCWPAPVVVGSAPARTLRFQG
jgi:hypothetical protein